MALLQVGVTMLNNHKVTLSKPNLWECRTFESCDNWKRTQTLSWSGLPSTHFVAFYETTTCHSTKAFLASEFLEPSGSIKLKTALPIRSVMVGRDLLYGRRPHNITRYCPKESATVEAPTNVSAIENEMSSNWFDALPDTTAS
jgi:hypothetical protein